MQVQVAKWGNSLVIVEPSAVISTRAPSLNPTRAASARGTRRPARPRPVSGSVLSREWTVHRLPDHLPGPTLPVERRPSARPSGRRRGPVSARAKHRRPCPPDRLRRSPRSARRPCRSPCQGCRAHGPARLSRRRRASRGSSPCTRGCRPRPVDAVRAIPSRRAAAGPPARPGCSPPSQPATSGPHCRAR